MSVITLLSSARALETYSRDVSGALKVLLEREERKRPQKLLTPGARPRDDARLEKAPPLASIGSEAATATVTVAPGLTPPPHARSRELEDGELDGGERQVPRHQCRVAGEQPPAGVGAGPQLTQRLQGRGPGESPTAAATAVGRALLAQHLRVLLDDLGGRENEARGAFRDGRGARVHERLRDAGAGGVAA